ncbi:MAG: Do family serine endopeptidase [Gemmataceae bacterium]
MKRGAAYLGVLLIGLTAGSFVVNNFLRGDTPAPRATGLAPETGSYRAIVKKVLPAVVSIEARAKVVHTKLKKSDKAPLDPRVPEEFRRFFEEFNIPDMPETPQGGMGSGFIVDPKGVVVTNNHVVAGAESVTVVFPDGRKIASRDIRTDPRTDLAVVILDNKAGATFPYLEFGDSDAMEIGDRVLAVGAPFGLTGTVTQGIVSSKGRGLNLNMYEDFIQTDAAINPGNSGGPLISLDGKVIGINSAIKSRSGGFQGVGLAVASNLAKGVVDKLKTDGVVHRGYLGVQIRDLDPDVARRLGIEDHGVVVGEVFADTPAGKAGLKPGDIIVAINGKHIDNGKALQRLIATLPLKKAAEFSLVRDGAALKAPVTIEEQPKDFGTARVPAPRPPSERSEGVSIDKMGLELGPLTPAAAEELGYRKDAKGVVIMRVEPGSLADAAGLRQGMLITRVEKEAVSTPEAARGALDKASLSHGVLLQVQSARGGANFVVIRSTDGA